MQVTSSIVAGHLIPFHNKNGKASISTFCRCHNNSLSVSGVEEILLLESTLRPDEVQFCSCCHCFCCCCCCCCWSRSKLKSYGFHLCLPPPIPVWYSFPVSFVYPLLSWLSLFIVRLLCFHFCSVLCQSPCWRRSIFCDFFKMSYPNKLNVSVQEHKYKEICSTPPNPWLISLWNRLHFYTLGNTAVPSFDCWSGFFPCTCCNCQVYSSNS